MDDKLIAMNIGVLGGGIVGLSAARILAERGHQITLYEQFAMFHERGSSHGRTRIVRRAYPDAFYTACMSEAYPMWAELEAASGRQLVDECGLLYFGDRDTANVTSMIAGLDANHVPYSVLKAENCRECISCVQLDPNEVGVFTPEAGWVNAAAALQASYDLARKAGTQFLQTKIKNLNEIEREHDAVIVASGAWITEFLDLDVKVSLQTFGYIDAQVAGPVWIDDPSLTYGFPSDDLGQKIGAHIPGESVDPNQTDRTPDKQQMRQLTEVAHRRFGNPNPQLTHVKTCMYTSTQSEDFRIGQLGTNSVFASACSGHGFKMGPWVGRILADIVEGKDTPENHPRFLWPRDLDAASHPLN